MIKQSKKFLIGLVIILVFGQLFLFVGCSSESKPQQGQQSSFSENNSPKETSSVPQTLAPTIVINPFFVTVSDSVLSVVIGVSGTATGPIMLDTSSLPSGVTASINQFASVITITGVRPNTENTNINGLFNLYVLRQGVWENGGVYVNLTTTYEPELPPPPVDADKDKDKEVDIDKDTTFGSPITEFTSILKNYSDELQYDETIGHKQAHKKIVLEAPLGTVIRAVYDGVIVKAETNLLYGKQILIDHGNGFMTSYGNLGDVDVRVGDEVMKGQRIGNVGQSSRVEFTEIPHLSFEIYFNGVRVDPNIFIDF